MAPLVVLVTVSVLARVAGVCGVGAVDSWNGAVTWGVAVMFVMTGITHFVPRRRRGLVAIVPPRLPHRGLLVSMTGVFELAGAAGLIAPRGWHMHVLAGWGLSMLLVVMFPANVYAAGARRSPEAPHTPLATRTILQIIFLSATMFVTITSH